MTSITLKVRDYLNKNPFIVKALNDEIVNVRALSTYILRNTGIDASLDAVMTAVRRFHRATLKEKKKEKLTSKIYKESRISTKSRLTIIEVKRHLRELKNIMPPIISQIHESKGDVFRIIGGRESIMFLIDHSKKEDIVKVIPKDELIGTIENIGEVNIHFSEKYGDIHGIVGPIINEIGINDINIIQIMGGMPALDVIINQKDISRCHDILLRLFYGDK